MNAIKQKDIDPTNHVVIEREIYETLLGLAKGYKRFLEDHIHEGTEEMITLVDRAIAIAEAQS